ncbi:MAG: PAS domain S-box protein, partial [Candidatus Eremiobacterota bacterium]
MNRKGWLLRLTLCYALLAMAGMLVGRRLSSGQWADWLDLFFVAASAAVVYALASREAARASASEQRAGVLFHSSRNILLLTDSTTGVVLDANQAAASFYGTDIGRLRGSTVHHLTGVPAAGLAQVVGLEEHRFRGRHTAADGTVRELEVFCSPLQGNTVLTLVQDATEQVRLQGQMAFYRSLVEQSRDPVYAADPLDDRVLYLNEAGRELVWAPETAELYASDLGLGHRPGDTATLLARAESAATLVESSLRSRDGQVTPVEVSASPIRWFDRTVLAGTIRDVSDRVERWNQLETANSRLRTILEAAPVAVITTTPDGVVTTWNPAADRIFGWTSGEVVGRPAPPEATFDPSLADGDSAVLESTQRDGSRLLLSVSVAPLKEHGALAGFVTVVEDVTEKDEALSRLALQGMALEAAANAVLITRADGTIEYVNAAFERITGYSRDEAVGATPRLLRSGSQDPAFYQNLWRTILSGSTWAGEVLNRRKDGMLYSASETITPMTDATGKVVRFVAIQEDVTQKKQAEARVAYQAFHDALTGLPNRALFMRRLEQELSEAEREGSLVSLLFFDLDRFKEVNDALGHHIGDQLLILAAERASGLLRKGDTLARFGGDEFAVLLSGTLQESHHPVALARRLCQAMEQPFSINGTDVYSSASVGIALGPQDGATPNELLQAADLAMYRAKERGRNTFEFFSSDIQAVA